MRTALILAGSGLGLLLVAPVVLLSIPFWSLRGLVLWYQRRSEPRPDAKINLMRFDPALGWRARAHRDAYLQIEGDDIYPFRTNGDGWPVSAPLQDADQLVVGDSFAFGYGAQAGEAFFELDRGPCVAAFGCPGYCMVQELLVLRELRPVLAGKQVVWLVYVENDIWDALRPHWQGYRKPFLQKVPGAPEWEIRSDHVSSRPWTASADPASMWPFSDLCTPGAFSERHYDACRYLLSEGARICRDGGATELVVVTVPNMNQLEVEGSERLRALSRDPGSFDPRYPHTRFEELCRTEKIRHVSGFEHFVAADYKEFERFHWNARGHRRMAELLASLLKGR